MLKTKSDENVSLWKLPEIPGSFGELQFDHFDRELTEIQIHHLGPEIFFLNTIGQNLSNDISRINFGSKMNSL